MAPHIPVMVGASRPIWGFSEQQVNIKAKPTKNGIFRP
jgi:hypothetical protein